MNRVYTIEEYESKREVGAEQFIDAFLKSIRQTYSILEIVIRRKMFYASGEMYKRYKSELILFCENKQIGLKRLSNLEMQLNDVVKAVHDANLLHVMESLLEQLIPVEIGEQEVQKRIHELRVLQDGAVIAEREKFCQLLDLPVYASLETMVKICNNGKLLVYPRWEEVRAEKKGTTIEDNKVDLTIAITDYTSEAQLANRNKMVEQMQVSETQKEMLHSSLFSPKYFHYEGLLDTNYIEDMEHLNKDNAAEIAMLNQDYYRKKNWIQSLLTESQLLETLQFNHEVMLLVRKFQNEFRNRKLDQSVTASLIKYHTKVIQKIGSSEKEVTNLLQNLDIDAYLKEQEEYQLQREVNGMFKL